MYKMNYRLACTILLLGLCLALLGNACTSRSGEIEVLRLGTTLGVLVDEEARVLDLFEDRSYYIAEELGMEVGDVVLSVNDEPVSLNPEDREYELDSLPEVSVKVLRNGEEIVLTTSLEDERAEVQAADAQLNELFAGKTKAESDALFEKYFIPYDPATAPPTATPAPDNTYGL